jgi:hypothetical protein
MPDISATKLSLETGVTDFCVVIMFWVCKDKLVFFCLCKYEGDWFIVVLALTLAL